MVGFCIVQSDGGSAAADRHKNSITISENTVVLNTLAPLLLRSNSPAGFLLLQEVKLKAQSEVFHQCHAGSILLLSDKCSITFKISAFFVFVNSMLAYS